MTVNYQILTVPLSVPLFHLGKTLLDSSWENVGNITNISVYPSFFVR